VREKESVRELYLIVFECMRQGKNAMCVCVCVRERERVYDRESVMAVKQISLSVGKGNNCLLAFCLLIHEQRKKFNFARFKEF